MTSNLELIAKLESIVAELDSRSTYSEEGAFTDIIWDMEYILEKLRMLQKLESKDE